MKTESGLKNPEHEVRFLKQLIKHTADERNRAEATPCRQTFKVIQKNELIVEPHCYIVKYHPSLLQVHGHFAGDNPHCVSYSLMFNTFVSLKYTKGNCEIKM